MTNDVTGALDRQDVLNQTCNHEHVFILDCFVKTVGYLNCHTSTIMTKRFDPFLSNTKEYCSYEIAATHEGFGHIEMATKIFVLILHVTCDQCQSSCELHKNFRFQTQQFVHGKCTSFTTLMELFNTLLIIV